MKKARVSRGRVIYDYVRGSGAGLVFGDGCGFGHGHSIIYCWRFTPISTFMVLDAKSK